MSKKGKWIMALVGLLIIAGAATTWYIFNETFSDTADRKVAFSVEANDFIREFETDSKLANQKYTEKIVAVNGIVSEVESADTTTNIKMIDTTKGSYIIFAFQQQHLADAKKLKEGDRVSIKGSCSGGTYSEILETWLISFKRCAINK